MASAPVIVAVDGSAASRQALRWAADYGKAFGAPVEAIIAWDIPTTYGMPILVDDAELKDRAERVLHDTIAEALGDSAPVTERVEKGHAGDVLVAASEHAALVVVGAHEHHHAAARILDSTSLHCVQHAHCPVVVIREW